MKTFRDIQEKRQISLMGTEVFAGDPGYGRFMGKERAYILQKGICNLYGPIRTEALRYFKENRISWWRGFGPTNNTLSSQVACLNHLLAIKNDKKAVLAILNGVRDEFEDVLPIPCDKEPAYISFEVVSDKDHLNEKVSTRGTQCTSVDAFIYAVHRGDHKRWLIPIEWKFVEQYAKSDKSKEDRHNEPKGSNGKGNERLARYSGLIDASSQLKSLPIYSASIYFQEPFYQLMRQTLWAEEMIKHSSIESLKADDYLHIHVIPKANTELLNRPFKVSGKMMEATWRGMLKDQTKYVIIDPSDLMKPLTATYPELIKYLQERYF